MPMSVIATAHASVDVAYVAAYVSCDFLQWVGVSTVGSSITRAA